MAILSNIFFWVETTSIPHISLSSRFHEGPQVLPVSHHLCGAGGAAFFLSCLAQRAADVEVIYEEQRCGTQSTLRRKKFKEALRDLDALRCGTLWDPKSIKIH